VPLAITVTQPKVIAHRKPTTSLSTSGPIRAYNPNGIAIGSAVFAQMTLECPYTWQCHANFPKIAYSSGDPDPI